MPKSRVVAIGAGPLYTSIRATIACHYLTITEQIAQGGTAKGLNYKKKDDSFTAVFGANDGASIEIIGHGRSGIIGRPPGYNASGVPALGDVILQVKAQDDTTCNVEVYESENEL